jgi:hypothetical protein
VLQVPVLVLIAITALMPDRPRVGVPTILGTPRLLRAAATGAAGVLQGPPPFSSSGARAHRLPLLG